MCYSRSSDCKVILDVNKCILRLTIGHSKFVKHTHVYFLLQVFKITSSLILKPLIVLSVGL